MKGVITNEVINSFLKCPYKAYLKLNHQKGEKTDFEKVEEELAAIYKENVSAQLEEKLHQNQPLLRLDRTKESKEYKITYITDQCLTSLKYEITFDPD